MRTFALVTAALAAAVLGGAAAPQEDSLGSLRAAAGGISGRPLPGAAAAMLAGAGDGRTVAIHPATNQVLVWGEGGELEDRGLAFLDPRGDLVAVEFDSGRRVVVSPAALQRAIGPLPLTGEMIPAIACLERLARSGGNVIAASGPLRPGWRLESNRHGRAIVGPTGPAGSWSAAGTDVELQTADGLHMLDCLELSAVLGEAPPSSAEAVRSLTALIQALEDGNTALDRLSEYQRSLAALANSSVSEAAAGRQPVSACRRLPTLSVICDRLAATFRQP